MGRKAIFTYGDKNYEGAIEKVASFIDPVSKSKRVHVLIDNSDGRLQVGMAGTLKLPSNDQQSSATESKALAKE
jgi:hypothetical protein